LSQIKESRIEFFPHTDAGMRFQFSLLTMLVCTAALALVSAVSVKLDVRDVTVIKMTRFGSAWAIDESPDYTVTKESSHPPTGTEIAWRMAWAGPLAVFVSLCLLWASRRIVDFMRPRV
jgi:hypothetical protein